MYKISVQLKVQSKNKSFGQKTAKFLVQTKIVFLKLLILPNEHYHIFDLCCHCSAVQTAKAVMKYLKASCYPVLFINITVLARIQWWENVYYLTDGIL